MSRAANLKSNRIYWIHVLIIFSVLCLNKLGIYAVSGEECLTFARQSVDPDWIPDSISISHGEPTRAIFYWIFGHIRLYLSHESTVLIGRGLNFLLYALGLALITRRLSFDGKLVFIFIQLTIWSRQAFFGGEWLFYSIEPKTFAYALVFPAIYYFLESRWRLCGLLLGLAAYLHILVVFWIIVALCLLLLWQKNWRDSLGLGGIAALISAPWIAYCYFSYFMDHAGSTEADHIFCYDRLPHHLGLFQTWDYFYDFHFWQVMGAILGLCMSIWVLRSSSKHATKRLAQIVIAILACNLLYVAVAYWDAFYGQQSCSLGLKLFPFRSSSIAFLCFNLVMILWINEHGRLSSKIKKNIKVVVLVALGIVLIAETKENFDKSQKSRSDSAYFEMIDTIKSTTGPGSLFLLRGIASNSHQYTAFARRAKRDIYFVPKFIPTDAESIARWTERGEAYERFKQDWTVVQMMGQEQTKVPTHILSTEILESQPYSVKHGKYYLYEIKKLRSLGG